MSDVLLGLLYVWVYFMYFDRVSCFSLGAWIGSNDLIMGSVCVTDKNEEKSEKA